MGNTKGNHMLVLWEGR